MRPFACLRTFFVFNLRHGMYEIKMYENIHVNIHVPSVASEPSVRLSICMRIQIVRVSFFFVILQIFIFPGFLAVGHFVFVFEKYSVSLCK